MKSWDGMPLRERCTLRIREHIKYYDAIVPQKRSIPTGRPAGAGGGRRPPGRRERAQPSMRPSTRRRRDGRCDETTPNAVRRDERLTVCFSTRLPRPSYSAGLGILTLL
ncbi:hypothetical protein EVAR_59262_1 [Eumeta japonica]|uniref:Uncharacterized protein n=1 Tax=Eumeta variegata TaxID=151549 RepID=A0A4C1YPJ3_EUMVA|nr:hypothetical protein EVAR_59262_1 [Eumeta japonica]